MQLWKCRSAYRRWGRSRRIVRITGAICVLLALLLILLCAPGWLIALVAAGLLFALGVWLLTGGGNPPIR